MSQHSQHRPTQITCRRAAVFSDIHSNYHAFQACYADARSQGADCFLFLGDYISDLADPAKTLDLVYEIRSRYPTICLLGNRERYMLEAKAGVTTFAPGSKTGSLLYTFERLRPGDFAFFESLSSYEVIEMNGVPMEIAHAAKGDDRYYFEKEDACIQTVFSQMENNWLLTGHSHKQYAQHHLGRTILNPGSVGIPQGGSLWPKYALIEAANGTIQYEFRQVPYDLKATIHAQFESGLVERARYWAISILHDILTGREYALTLVSRVQQRAQGSDSAIRDECLWHEIACELGMRFTEREILALLDEERS